MNRKIFAGVVGVVVLLLAFVWQLAAGGVAVGPRVDDLSGGSHTLWSFMSYARVDINGILEPGWDVCAYKTTITMREIGGAPTDTMDADIWIMNDARYLYIALRWEDSTPRGNDVVLLWFDEEHDHQINCTGDTGYPEYAGTEERYMFSEDSKGAWGNGEFYDYYYSEPTVISWDTADPTGTVDGAFAWSWSSDFYSGEWRLPLNSGDKLDINVRSGAILGLYIMFLDLPALVQWAYGAPPQTGAIEQFRPENWEDLHTTKVYSASIPHAHDDVTSWRAWLGVQNTGTRESTVVFTFSDYLTDIPVPAGANVANFVKEFHGGTNYIGPILIHSDQPFTASLGQRDAGKNIMGWSVYVGEN